MEEDDVSIREQNFHSQVREYIVSQFICLQLLVCPQKVKSDGFLTGESLS